MRVAAATQAGVGVYSACVDVPASAVSDEASGTGSSAAVVGAATGVSLGIVMLIVLAVWFVRSRRSRRNAIDQMKFDVVAIIGEYL